MLQAARLVMEGKSVRGTAKDFNINYKTLGRFCKKCPEADLKGSSVLPSISVGYSKPGMSSILNKKGCWKVI